MPLFCHLLKTGEVKVTTSHCSFYLWSTVLNKVPTLAELPFSLYFNQSDNCSFYLFGDWTIVLLPLLLSGPVTIVLFTFRGIGQLFLLPLLLSGPKKKRNFILAIISLFDISKSYETNSNVQE